MNGGATDDKDGGKFINRKQGAFSRFGFAVGRIAPYNTSESPRSGGRIHQSSPSPSKMLAACRGRGYASSAVDDVLRFTTPSRKFTDETETVSSSHRHERESCSSEPTITRSNSLINPVALTLLCQEDDDEDENECVSARSSPPQGNMSTAPQEDDSNVLQHAEAPPAVHADPPPCCRPRAIRPSPS